MILSRYALLATIKNSPGLEVIKLEYSLRVKIKRNDFLLCDHISFGLLNRAWTIHAIAYH